jgi:tetratricopeptide (TPR) repeat protein
MAAGAQDLRADCPRCALPDVTTPECPRCGVVLAKARVPSPRPLPAAADTEDRRPAWRVLWLPGLGLMVVLAAAVLTLRRPEPPASPAARAPESAPASAHLPADAELSVESPALETVAPVAAPEEALRLQASAVEADQATAQRLAAKLQRHAPLASSDLREGEDLYLRYDAPARPLFEALLLTAAVQEQQRRQPARALEHVRRAVALAPDSAQARRALTSVLVEVGDWAGAEAAAHALLALAPGDVPALRTLALVLVRQDRSDEALELLRTALDSHDDPTLRALRDRLARDARGEHGMSEQRLAHFHLRYDGEEHEAVGREILRVLDRHYATLVRAFDHQPLAPIPVILFSTRSYYDATGAPGWSGGHYDTFDGRVRIPIGGLTASLTPDLDGALLHELTHAFVAERSRGIAPRQVQEGLAQYMEGKRVDAVLGADGLQALADGRIGGVSGFYLAALAFVEHLIAQRGQGGINELLAVMSETGSSDEAFRRVYGRDMRRALEEWASRLRREHGS